MQPQKQILNKHLQAFSQLTDLEVVKRVIGGDQALFELIMRRYNRRLFRVARGILGNDGSAEDAVQESYISAFQHLEQFRGPQGFGAWLTQICTRTAIRVMRHESRLFAVHNNTNIEELTESRGGKLFEPEATTQVRETARVLEGAIELLPKEFRLVYILRDLEGLSVEETADSLGINRGTVKSRLHRARKIVRTRCQVYLGDIKASTFPFAGQRCNRIVESVFAALCDPTRT